jgi:hypothetical protein
MRNLQVYLRGKPFHGLVGAGAIIHARRDEEPCVKQGRNYTIRQVIVGDLGSCSRNLRIKLKGIPGDYSRNTFFLTEKCFRQMKENGYFRNVGNHRNNFSGR